MNRIYEDLTKNIIGCAFKVHGTLGSGFLESVYEKALFLELTKEFDDVERQFPILVRYDGQEVGVFQADLIVEHKVIVELKAVEVLHRSHEIQVMNYLKATGFEVGLLMNFGAERLEVRRKALVLPPLPSSPVSPAHPVIRSLSSEDNP